MNKLITDDKYWLIHRWMLTQLELKGAELNVYAFLYGFYKGCEHNAYYGTIETISEFLGISYKSVSNSIKTLEEKHLIYKIEQSKGKGFIKYYSYEINPDTIPSFTVVKIADDTVEKIADDNVSTLEKNADIYNKSLNKNISNSIYMSVCKNVIECLNNTAGTNFQYKSKSSNEDLIARLKEGFKEEDFIKVIKKKNEDWKGTEYYKFMKPSTLFSKSHFEDYLNQPEVKAKGNKKIVPISSAINNVVESEEDEETGNILKGVFDEL